MRIKPFRQYDEHDVINLYSLAEASGNAGELVELQAWNPTDSDGYDGSTNFAPFNGISIPRYVNKAKVRLATSGNTNIVLGAMLWDVRETDALGRPLNFDAQRYYELQVATSGQTVPVMTKGMLLVSGHEGTPGPGSGIATADGGLGNYKVVGPAVTPNIGRWLSSTGSDGYAFAYINCLK